MLIAGTTSLMALLAQPALAQTRRPLAAMTEGPFYPPRAWREAWADQDADLTRVRGPTGVRSARGEHLGLELAVADTAGRAIDGAAIEIWQCDALGAYRHPAQDNAPRDDGFQGFGAATADAQGIARLRTIRPVPYPGRTPHIHVRLRHASFGTLTSQLFVAGDAGNARDFLWRSLNAADQVALALQLQPAAADSGLRWQARHAITVPA